MARSDYIYIAVLNNKLAAAFTVKRELIFWLSKQSAVAVDMLEIYKLKDNGNSDQVPLPLDKEKLING